MANSPRLPSPKSRKLLVPPAQSCSHCRRYVCQPVLQNVSDLRAPQRQLIDPENTAWAAARPTVSQPPTKSRSRLLSSGRPIPSKLGVEVCPYSSRNIMFLMSFTSPNSSIPRTEHGCERRTGGRSGLFSFLFIRTLGHCLRHLILRSIIIQNILSSAEAASET